MSKLRVIEQTVLWSEDDLPFRERIITPAMTIQKNAELFFLQPNIARRTPVPGIEPFMFKDFKEDVIRYKRVY